MASAERPCAWVVVLNWNGLAHLPECLGSLAEVEYPNLRVVVVDNGSADGSQAYIEEAFPQFLLLPQPENLGFCGGNNVGMRRALEEGADYVILLNNDTRVDPGFVQALVEAGEADPTAGILGGTVRLYYDPELLNSTGVQLNLWGYGCDRDFAAPADTQRPAGEVLAVTGCLLAAKRAVLEQVGLLDERFFAYYEDVDLCLRTWERGAHRVVHVPEATVYHKFSASTVNASKTKALLYTRNQYRVLLKHYPFFQLLRTAPGFCSHRLRMLWDQKGAMVYTASYRELAMVAAFLARIPFLPLLRLPALVSGRYRPSRFWRLVTQQRGLPSNRPYCPERARIVRSVRELTGAEPPSRMVMGVHDQVLGPGWSTLVEDFPRYRKLEGRAACYLAAARGARFLQVHLFSDPVIPPGALEAEVAGRPAGRKKLVPGWQTCLFELPSPVRPGPVEVALRYVPRPSGSEETTALRVNEVALLGIGAPSLRLLETP